MRALRIAHPKDATETLRGLEEQEVRAVDPRRRWNGQAYVLDADPDEPAEYDPPEVVRAKLGLPVPG